MVVQSIFLPAMEPGVNMYLVERDLAEALKFMQTVKASVASTTTLVNMLLKKAKNGEFKTSKGISLFEVKFHSLLSYLINMTLVIQSKCNGQRIDGHPSVFRLAELRTVIEKLRPIEQKLKYHVDKLVKASFGAIGEDDPLRFRANPQNMMNKLKEDSADDEDEDSDEEGGNSRKKSGAYEPPKLMAVHYEDDLDKVSLREKRMEKAKKRAMSSSIIKDLQQEYYDGPEEMKDTTNKFLANESSAAKRRTEYEEQNFVRLNLSKAEKHSEKKKRSSSGFNSLTHFSDINALNNDDLDDDRPKKKPKFNKKGSKSKKFRIRHKKR